MYRGSRLVCTALVVTGCTRQYTSHLEPLCPPAAAVPQVIRDVSVPASIVATVLDRDTGRPVAGALVRVMPGDRHGISDSLGTVALHELTAERYTLTTLRIGYQRRADTIEVRAGAGVRAQLVLTSAGVDRCMELHEVRTPMAWWHFW